MARLWRRTASRPPLQGLCGGRLCLHGEARQQRRGSNPACPVHCEAAAGTLPFQPPEGMILRAGALTIKLGDEVIGAIGVGGAPSAEADEVCAPRRAGQDPGPDPMSAPSG
jgi:hypothetical protein